MKTFFQSGWGMFTLIVIGFGALWLISWATSGRANPFISAPRAGVGGRYGCPDGQTFLFGICVPTDIPQDPRGRFEPVIPPSNPDNVTPVNDGVVVNDSINGLMNISNGFMPNDPRAKSAVAPATILITYSPDCRAKHTQANPYKANGCSYVFQQNTVQGGVQYCQLVKISCP